MTNKELIKQDIKRRISNLEKLGDREHIKKYFAEQFRFIEVYEGLIKFIDSLPEEHNEDLEEAAKRYATEGDEINGLYIIDEEVDAFKAGAEWQKQQMMKDAVEGIVGGYTNIPAFINLEIEHKPNVKVGDKVKIVVLKTE